MKAPTGSTCVRQRRAAFVVSLCCSALLSCDGPFPEQYDKFREIRNGMTEAQVIEKLGTPTLVYTKENAPQDYYVDGRDYEKREISGKVLIFVRGEPIAYVYLGTDGLVEHVFVGGS